MSQSRKPPSPLDEARLTELALAYVARFATSRAKLSAYCRRKLKERGWQGDSAEHGLAAIERIADRLVDLRYIDDSTYAMHKSAALGRRGYGARRVSQALGAAGIGDDDRSLAMDQAGARRWQAAIALARRRKLGPYGNGADDPAGRQRQLATLLRGGHDMDIARAIVSSRDTAMLEQAVAEEREMHEGDNAP